MNAMVNTKTQSPSVLDGLAMQAQMFVQNAAMNLLQLGRVLTEAKPLVPRGEWDAWIRENAKMSRRTAEQYMQAYAEFGVDSRIAELGTTKVLKLMPMPEEERRQLLEENDVAAMSTRQLEEAIRRQSARLRQEALEEAQAAIDAADRARAAAERRAEAAEQRPAELPEDVAEKLRANEQTISELRAENARVCESCNDVIAEKIALTREINALQREMREREEDIAAMQADFDRTQEELLNLQSAQARGDAERLPADTLTAEAFTLAVNTFVGACCRLPQMGRALGAMSDAEREQYEQSLRVIESWAKSARQALDTVTYGEAIFIG